ncbi:uncharacterized protein BJ171DRAFT_490730 [Polychytrium aggregatum]|uniref:uncharacterized protein n=1 Tax=Polychytrium aggregatum TaxID=110093 RepID=UPI0022FF2449|nr:uncharacterized protein BJ171DRAFT_490730 [Polychytrium aggregatum]KAI9208240.1 hypothetical protein BJ171DRAFT_490730 [Polychytrium aggregatum]
MRPKRQPRPPKLPTNCLEGQDFWNLHPACEPAPPLVPTVARSSVQTFLPPVLENDLVYQLSYFRRTLGRKDLRQEHIIIDRMIYKNRQQHRGTTYLAKFLEVQKYLRRLQAMGLEKLLADALDVMQPNNKKTQSWEAFPSRRYLAFTLFRMVGSYKLIQKLLECSEDTYLHFQAVLRQTYFMPLCLIAMSSLARLHILGRHLLCELRNCYDLVYSWIQYLPKLPSQSKDMNYEAHLKPTLLKTIGESSGIELSASATHTSQDLDLLSNGADRSDADDADRLGNDTAHEHPKVEMLATATISDAFWGSLSTSLSPIETSIAPVGPGSETPATQVDPDSVPGAVGTKRKSTDAVSGEQALPRLTTAKKIKHAVVATESTHAAKPTATSGSAKPSKSIGTALKTTTAAAAATIATTTPIAKHPLSKSKSGGHTLASTVAAHKPAGAGTKSAKTTADHTTAKKKKGSASKRDEIDDIFGGL